MDNNIYAKINRILTWKRVVSFNLLLLVALVIPLSVKLTQENADNRSNAANNVIPSATPIPNYPKQAPQIERVTLFYGKPGDTVVLLGKNFGAFPWDKSQVFVGNKKIKKEGIVRWKDKVVEVEIPEGAVTGKVWIRINGKTSVWPGTLLIYNPTTSGKIGLDKQNNQAVLWLNNERHLIKHLNIKLSFTGGQVGVQAYPNVEIKKQIQEIDDFGTKLSLDLDITGPMLGSKKPLLRLSKANGQIEILEAKPTTAQNKIVPIWADPLALKVNF